MKKIFSVTLALFLFTLASAQTHDNFTVKSVVKTEGLPDDMAAFGEMEIVSYIKGGSSRTEAIGMMFSSIAFFDGKTLTYLADFLGTKMGYRMTKQEMEENQKKEKKKRRPVIEYTKEKKMIAGYECTKVLVITPEEDASTPASLSAETKKENVTTVWVTDKIQPSAEVRKANKRGVDLGDIKGMPLEMESFVKMNGSNARVIMSTKEISTEKIEDSFLIPATEGYSMVSYQEMMDKMNWH